MDDLVALPEGGRCYTRSRAVEVSDITRSGRIGLATLARYAQDIAADDAHELGVRGVWVARRVVLRLGVLPGYGNGLVLRTAVTGMGSRWVERRTSVAVEAIPGAGPGARSRGGGDAAPPGSVAEVAALWVHVDTRGRPVRIPPERLGPYAASVAARTVSSRLHHGAPPPDAVVRAWPLRSADFDTRGHVNNTAPWAAVDDEVDRVESPGVPVDGEIEYRAPIECGDVVELHRTWSADELWCWLVVADAVRVSARVGFRGSATPVV